jgi:hypothetical protein
VPPETRKLLLLPLLLVAIFLVANRTAYKGYFDPDDLDNIGWTHKGRIGEFVQGLAAPKFYRRNYRPAGHLLYRLMGGTFGLRYAPYLAALQLLHILAILLLWLLLRELGFTPWAAFLGGLFFACHMGAFEAYWKPMYVFDVLCGVFSLLCLLCYIRGRWMVALAAMWLAYKSKELAVMLPVALAWWEWRLGERRWKRLLPFFGVSLLFGIQALVVAPNPDNDYTFQFGPAALATTLRFYSTRLGLLPWAGLGLLAVPVLARDRRATWGVITFAALMVPLMVLPGRLFGVYLYVPLLGAAVALSALAARSRRALVGVACFYLLWIPLNFRELRVRRNTALAEAADNRTYVAELTRLRGETAKPRLFLYDGMPDSMRPWGLEGALRVLFGFGVEAESLETVDLAKLGGREAATLSWNPLTHRLVAAPRGKVRSWVEVSDAASVWQLTAGWYAREARYRWTLPRATARLLRPAGATRLVVTVNVPQLQLDTVGHPRLQPFLDGVPLEAREFSTAGWQTESWELAPGAAGEVTVEFRTTPEYRPPGDSRRLGVPLGSFGFKQDIRR